MATLEKIRNKAGLLVTIVGLALFAFIIGDFLNSGSTYFRQSQDKVVDVDGTSIRYQEFQRRVDEMSDVYKLQTGQTNLPEEYSVQIQQSVYDGFVQEVLLFESMDKLGMVVSPEELFDMVQGENISSVLLQNPMFQNPQTGQFDKSALLNFLKTIDANNIAASPAEQQAMLLQYRNLWLFWEKNIKLQRMEQKYTTLLSKAIAANKLDARDNYDATAENSDIVYAMQNYRSIPDSTVQVSSSEISKLYEQRKSLYPQEEAKVISYLSKQIIPSQEDFSNAQAGIDALKAEFTTTTDIKDFVAENSEIQYTDAFFSANALDPEMKKFAETATVGEVYGPFFEQSANKYRMFRLIDKTVAPDSVHAYHIMFLTNNGAEPAAADSLLDVIKKGGDFAQLAAAYSVDQNSSARGGEIGWLTEAEAVQAVDASFRDALFNAPLNQVTKFSNSQAVHLIKITERTANVPKYKIADIDHTVTPSTKTYNNMYNDLNRFVAEHTLSTMDTAAQNAGYSFYKNTEVLATAQTVGAVPQSRQVVRWAFNNKKGEQSEIFDCGSQYFVVAFHEGSIAKGYRSLQSLETTLRAEIASQKKGEKIAADLKAKNISSLDAYAQAMGSQVDSVKFINFATQRITGIGVEPKLNAEIALAQQGSLSSPVAGNNGVYVFTVTNRSTSSVGFNEQSTVSLMNASNSYRYGFQALQFMINHADIQDNRIRFY